MTPIKNMYNLTVISNWLAAA